MQTQHAPCPCLARIAFVGASVTQVCDNDKCQSIIKVKCITCLVEAMSDKTAEANLPFLIFAFLPEEDRYKKIAMLACHPSCARYNHRVACHRPAKHCVAPGFNELFIVLHFSGAQNGTAQSHDTSC